MMEGKTSDKLDTKPISDVSIISENNQTFKGIVKWVVPIPDIYEIQKHEMDRYTQTNEARHEGFFSLFRFSSGHTVPLRNKSPSYFSKTIKSSLFSIGSPPYCAFNLIMSLSNHYISISILFKSQLPEDAWITGEISDEGELNEFESFSLSSKEANNRIRLDNILNIEPNTWTWAKGDIIFKCCITIKVRDIECVVDNYKVNFTEIQSHDSLDDLNLLSGLISPRVAKTDRSAQNQTKLNLLSRRSKISDVTLMVEQREIKSYKAILSKVPFFEKLFQKNKSKEYFELTDISLSIFETILDYLYDGAVPILNLRLACELYVAACDLNIYDLKNICSSYLGSHITQENVFIIISLSDAYTAINLKKDCIKFIKASNVETLAVKSIAL